VGIAQALRPFDEAVKLLPTIPGIGAVAEMAIMAEIGVDMGRFPSGRYLASWASVCPGNKESGGKRLSGKTTEGNVWLRGMLWEMAWSIARANGTYLHAQYHRIARRRGKYEVVAIAYSVLVIIYYMLRDKRAYAISALTTSTNATPPACSATMAAVSNSSFTPSPCDPRRRPDYDEDGDLREKHKRSASPSSAPPRSDEPLRPCSSRPRSPARSARRPTSYAFIRQAYHRSDLSARCSRMQKPLVTITTHAEIARYSLAIGGTKAGEALRTRQVRRYQLIAQRQ